MIGPGVVDQQFRIAIAAVVPTLRGRGSGIGGKAGDVGAQRAQGVVVNRGECGDDGFDIVHCAGLAGASGGCQTKRASYPEWAVRAKGCNCGDVGPNRDARLLARKIHLGLADVA